MIAITLLMNNRKSSNYLLVYSLFNKCRCPKCHSYINGKLWYILLTQCFFHYILFTHIANNFSSKGITIFMSHTSVWFLYHVPEVWYGYYTCQKCDTDITHARSVIRILHMPEVWYGYKIRYRRRQHELRSRVIRLCTGKSKWYKPNDKHAHIMFRCGCKYHTWLKKGRKPTKKKYDQMIIIKLIIILSGWRHFCHGVVLMKYYFQAFPKYKTVHC